MGNVFTIHANEYFLDTLARGILEKFPADSPSFANLRILLPHQRACGTLRQLLYKHSGQKALIMPSIHSFNDLASPAVSKIFGVDMDIEKELVSDITLRLKMYQHAKESSAKISDWALASEAYQLFDEIKQYNGSLNAAKFHLENSYSDYFDAYIKPLFNVLEECSYDLEKSNKISNKELIVNVLKEIDVTAFNEENPLVIAGTTASTYAVSELVSSASGSKGVFVVVQGLDQLIDQDVWTSIKAPHPQALFVALFEKLGLNFKETPHWISSQNVVESSKLLSTCMLPASAVESWHKYGALKGGGDDMSFFAGENEEDEARFIALKMREHADKKGKVKALITPDKKLANRVERHLLRWDIHVDNTLGVAAERSDVARLLKQSLEVSCGKLVVADLLALLKMLQSESDPAISEVEINVLRKGAAVHSIQDLCEWVIRSQEKLSYSKQAVDYLSEVADILSPLSELKPSFNYSLKKLLSKHRKILLELLKLHKREDLTSGEEGEKLLNWMDNLIESAPEDYEVRFDQYTEVLDAMLQSSTLHRVKGVTPDFIIISPIEARLHQYEVMILGGMNQERWFPAAHDMIGNSLRGFMGLPLAEDHDNLVLHDIFCLLNAETLIVTYSTMLGGSPALPANWVNRYMALLTILGAEITYDAMGQFIDRLDEATISSVKPPVPCPEVEVRPKQLSTTKVDWLANNPYIFFVDQILVLKPLDSLNSEDHLDARLFGNILHRFAEAYVKKREAENITNKMALLELAQEIAFREIEREQLPVYIAVQWRSRVGQIVEAFVEEDIKRIAGVKGCLLEHSSEVDFDGVKVRGRIDRIELSYGGKAVVVDYKTSTIPENKQLEAGLANQLLIASVFVMSDEGFDADLVDVVYWAFSGTKQGTKFYQTNDSSKLNQYKLELGEWLNSYLNQPTPFLWLSHMRPYIASDTYSHLAREQEWC